MLSMNFCTAILFALVCCVSGQVAQWPTDSNSSTSIGAYYDGNVLTISWAPIEGGPSDLWIASIDGIYQDRLTSNVMIDRTGSFAWKIAVGSEEIAAHSNYRLYLIPTGKSFDAQAVDSYNAGPQLMLVNPGDNLPMSVDTSLPTTTLDSGTSMGSIVLATSVSGSAATIVTLDASAMTSAASLGGSGSNGQSGLSDGAKAGISIAILVALLIVLGLLVWALRLRRKVKAATNHRSSGIIPSSGFMPEKNNAEYTKRVSGVHEVPGDRHQPVEMDNPVQLDNSVQLDIKRKTVYHELAG